MVQQLPYAVNAAQGLVVADYAVFKLTSPACTVAGGSVLCWSGPVDPGYDYAWLLTNVVVQNTSSTLTGLGMYIGANQGDVSSIDLAAGSSAGNLDFDDVPPAGLFIQSGESVTFQWTGCSIGAVGRARMQITKLRQTT